MLDKRQVGYLQSSHSPVRFGHKPHNEIGLTVEQESDTFQAGVRLPDFVPRKRGQEVRHFSYKEKIVRSNRTVSTKMIQFVPLKKSMNFDII